MDRGRGRGQGGGEDPGGGGAAPRGGDCPEPPTLEEICAQIVDAEEALAYLQDYEGYVEEERSVAASHIRRLERKVSRLETKCT